MIRDNFPGVGMGTTTPLAVPEQLNLAPTFMIVTILNHHERRRFAALAYVYSYYHTMYRLQCPMRYVT